MRTELQVNLTKEKSLTVYSNDDVEEVLEHNKLLRTLPQKSDWGKHKASIPPIICVKWLNEEMARGHYVRFLSKEFDELVARKLRDPEYAYLLTDGPKFRAGWGD